MRYRSALLTAFGVVCLMVTASVPAAPRPARAADADAPRVIEVVARRFTWEPSVIEVTVGERVRLVVRTADGLHGIELKKFKINKEIPRGKPTVVEFTADEAGRFPFVCSEYCGEGHDDMKGVLVVLARDAPPDPPQETAAPQN